MELGFGDSRNVGGIDRLLRAGLAVVALAAGGWALLAGEPLVAGVALLAGAGFTFNAVTQFCVANQLLGIDTCSWDGAGESR
jgi:hypothetical protein